MKFSWSGPSCLFVPSPPPGGKQIADHLVSTTTGKMRRCCGFVGFFEEVSMKIAFLGKYTSCLNKLTAVACLDFFFQLLVSCVSFFRLSGAVCNPQLCIARSWQ